MKEELLEGFGVTWGLMLPQFDRDVFDISPDKIAKVDNLHIPDLPMLQFPQNLTQNKKIQLSCYLSCNLQILRAIPLWCGLWRPLILKTISKFALMWVSVDVRKKQMILKVCLCAVSPEENHWCHLPLIFYLTIIVFLPTEFFWQLNLICSSYSPTWPKP